MNALMYLKRLEDFTPRVALRVINSYLEPISKNIKIRKEQLNLVQNGICDSNMKKYVVSIGDALYQVVAVDPLVNKPIYVVVDCFRLCGTRRYSKELKPEERPEKFKFTDIEACSYLKECMSKSDSNRSRLHPNIFTRVNNGILDDNMIKYVVSTGYGLYQIVAIDDKSRISLVVKYSQI